MSAKLNPIDVKGKLINVGVDIHQKSWRVTGLVEASIVLAVTIAKPDYHSFKKVINRFAGNQIRVAYEAGFSGFDLFDRLSADGIECIVTPPSLIPTESGSRVKTDKKDSLKLAKLLESGMLKKVYVLSPEQRGHRQLVRTKRQIVRHRCDVMRQIKSFLMFHRMSPMDLLLKVPHQDSP